MRTAFARSFNSSVPINCHIDDDVPEIIMADSKDIWR
jgi:hypothetical protein